MGSGQTSLNVTRDLLCLGFGESRRHDLAYSPEDSPHTESWLEAGLSSLLLQAGPGSSLAPSSDLQVLPFVATQAAGSPPAAFQAGHSSQSGSRPEFFFFFFFLSSDKQKSLPVRPIGLAVPDVSGGGSRKAALAQGFSTALPHGRVHVTFPLVLDGALQSSGDALKLRLLQSQQGKPNSRPRGKKGTLATWSRVF